MHLDTISGTINQQRTPWIIARDFNAIADIGEKRGGQQIDMGAVQDFQHFIMCNDLVDAGYTGDVYTWCNDRQGQERIWELLDRVLCN